MPRPRGAGNKARVFTPERKAQFCESLAETGCVQETCRALGVRAAAAYSARDHDLQFRERWDAAALIGTTVLEAEAHRRAVHGVKQHVWYKGEVCGDVTNYSDALLALLLKAQKPALYRERMTIGGEAEAPLHVNVTDLRAKVEARIMELAKKKGA